MAEPHHYSGKAVEDTEYDFWAADLHYCSDCLTDKPWTHRKDPAWLILLRKLGRILTGRFRIEFH